MKKHLIAVALVLSLCYNFYQSYKLNNSILMEKLTAQRERIVADGYNEMFANYLQSIREGQIEIATNQGKIEGILMASNNYKPDENTYRAIWHAGYDRGSEVGQNIVKVAYEKEKPVKKGDGK